MSIYGARHQGGRGAMKPENVFHQLRGEIEDNYREVASGVFEVGGLYLKPGKSMVRVYTSVPDGSEYHDGFINMDEYPYGKVGAFKGRGTADSERVEFQYASQFLEDSIQILKNKLGPMREQKLTPCRLKEIVQEEVQRLLSEDDIGWDNLPDGWDEDSLDSFARSLTDKTQDDSEGFFSACMDEVEDKFDDPEAFCASLKDEYLDTTDWRGESTNKNQHEMKLTESKLQEVIREEIEEMVSGNAVAEEFHNYLSSVGTSAGGDTYQYDGLYFHIDPMGGFTTFVNVFQDKHDSESVASAKIEQDGKMDIRDEGMRPGATDTLRYKGPEAAIKALASRAQSPPKQFGRGR